MSEVKTAKPVPRKATPRQGLAGLVERVTANPTKTFGIVLLLLAVFFLGYGNWPLVRFSLLGINVDLPGTLLYALFFLIGMLAMWFWVRPQRPPSGDTPAEEDE